MFELNLMLADDQAGISCPLEISGLHRYCTLALQQQSRLDTDDVSQIEMSVQMLDSESMRALNQQYRNKDSATNVLSFESGMPVLGDSETQKLLALGDLVFCPEVIASEACAQAKSEDGHWAHLVVHGTLHLCGYDHLEPADATEMENLEIQILLRSGIANPYQAQPVQ